MATTEKAADFERVLSCCFVPATRVRRARSYIYCIHVLRSYDSMRAARQSVMSQENISKRTSAARAGAAELSDGPTQ